MDEYKFSIHKCDSRAELEASEEGRMVILYGLGENILKRVGKIELGRALRIFIQDKNNRVVGGVSANAFGGWVYIELLWIKESLRNMGYGTKLMEMLEQEAMQMGCKHAHLDTYSFEARPFYERLGYELFGTLENYPEGHCKYFLKKTLVQ
ncbi:MAG: GNAT family N-acetyltransferase [candidate division Zixibacteria bacterium]|nr:GNAT family N-acetyltransferase [candidate division Zixibacteria bacterium]